MRGIVDVTSEEEELQIILESEVTCTFHREGMTIETPECVVNLDWEATDRVCNLARGAKVIYANGQVPVIKKDQ